MAYTRINWEDSPSTKTPINAENLNKMDQGIFNAHEQLGKIPEWSKEKEKPNYTADEVGAYSKEEIDVLKANSILSKASGEVVTTTDSAKAPLKNIRLYGKTEQPSTEGNQLLNIDNMEDYAFGNIITVSKDGEYIKLECTLSDTDLNLEYPIPCEIASGTTVYLYVPEGDTTDITFALLDADKNVVSDLYIGTPCTLSSDVAFFKISCSEDISTKLKIMLSDKENAEWEPYVGCEPSPNINYPQPLNSHGDSGSIVGKVLSGNLLHPNLFLVNCTYDGDGVYSAKSNAETVIINCNNASLGMQEMRIPNGDVYLSLEIEATNTCTLSYVFLCTQGSSRRNYSFGVNKTVTNSILKVSTVFTLTNDVTHFGVALYFSNKTPEGLKIKNVQVRIGSEEKDYEPYTEQPFTVLTPNGLPGIPLGQTIPNAIKNSPIHMAGVYWDNATSQYYIGNTKDYENREYVQRVKEFGIENYSLVRVPIDSNWYDSEKSYSYECEGLTYIDGTCGSFCTHAINHSFANFYSKGIENGCFIGQGNLVFNISKSLGICTTKDEFIQYCKDNNVKIMQILADPIITDLTQEELDQYNALLMNYPNTTVVNDAGAYMEVEYVADTKCYIDNKFKELQTALANTNAQLL